MTGSKRLAILLAIAAGIAGSTAAGATPNPSAPPPGTRTLLDSVGALVSRAQVLGSVAGSTPVHLVLPLALPAGDQAALDRFVTAQYTPGSPSFHAFLRPASFGRRFGAPRREVDSAIAALRGLGFSVAEPGANRLFVTADGTLATAEAAFRTTVARLLAPGGASFSANVKPITLPASLSGLVSGVIGLDQSALPHANLMRGSPAGAAAALRDSPRPAASGGGASPCVQADLGGYTAPQIAQAYDFNGLYDAGYHGEGMSAALVEFDDYHDSNVAGMESCYGISTPVTRRLVDGGSGGPPSGGEIEDMADISALLEMAPGLSHLYVYVAPISGTAELDLYNAFVNDDVAPILSSSWGNCEEIASQADNHLFALLAEEAAAQGQQIFDAAGDSGAVDCRGNPPPTGGSLSVEEEAAVPWITGVGGTDLGVATVLPASPVHDEATWNDSGAGGGGVSGLWRMPGWQAALPSARNAPGASGAACGAPAGSLCREVPDISMNADPLAGGALDMTRIPPQLFPDVGSPGYSIYCNTGNCSLASIVGIPSAPLGIAGWEPIGGTSLATPVAAAAAALWDQEARAKGLSGLGFLNASLYRVAADPAKYAADFFDITSDTNDAQYDSSDCPSGCNPRGLFAAASGYDMASGLGSIDAAKLGTDLIADAGRIDTTPDSVSLYGYLGGPATTEPVSVTSGLHSARYTAQSDASWLHVKPGSAPGSLTYSASPTGLGAGSYMGHIKLSAPDGGTASVTVSYSITPRATVGVSTAPLQFSERAIDSNGATTTPTCGSTIWNDELKDQPGLNGGGGPLGLGGSSDTTPVDASTKQKLAIANTGPAASVLHWSAYYHNDTGGWLNVDFEPRGAGFQTSPSAPLVATGGSLAGGAQTSIPFVSVANISTLAGVPSMNQGTYHGEIEIRDLADPSTHIVVPAILVLGNGTGTPTIAPSPAAISLTLSPGQSQVVPLVLSDASHKCGYVYSLQTNVPWASVNRDLFSGTVGATAATSAPNSGDTGGGNGYVPITISAGALAPGVHHSSITINSQNAEPNPTVVPITLTIPGGAAGNSSACKTSKRLRYALHTPRHVRVVAVTVTSGRKVLRRARGHSLRNVTVKRPKGKRFTITITTTFSNGVKIRSTRTYDGCKRGKVRSKIVRRARRR